MGFDAGPILHRERSCFQCVIQMFSLSRAYIAACGGERRTSPVSRPLCAYRQGMTLASQEGTTLRVVRNIIAAQGHSPIGT